MSFEIGKTYWGIRTGWGMDDIRRVKLLKEIRSDDKLIGFESKDVNPDFVGTCGIELKYLFDSKKAAENYRDKMAAAQINVIREKTDTPEKMLSYLLDSACKDSDGYCDYKIMDDIRNRAQQLFKIKIIS